jgi:hypothetical protein
MYGIHMLMRFLPYAIHAKNHAGHGIYASFLMSNEVGELYASVATEVVLLEKSGGNEVFYHIPSMHKTMPREV